MKFEIQTFLQGLDLRAPNCTNWKWILPILNRRMTLGGYYRFDENLKTSHVQILCLAHGTVQIQNVMKGNWAAPFWHWGLAGFSCCFSFVWEEEGGFGLLECIVGIDVGIVLLLGWGNWVGLVLLWYIVCIGMGIGYLLHCCSIVGLIVKGKGKLGCWG